jgi:hypothetical protein
MAASRGPPGVMRVMKKTTSVAPISVGMMNRNRRMK